MDADKEIPIVSTRALGFQPEVLNAMYYRTPNTGIP